MKRHLTPTMFLATLTVVIGLVVSSAAQQVGDAELLLQQALHTQEVEGNLPEAVKLFEQVAAARSAGRETRARALLELGKTLDTLGRPSERVYRQIVSEFGDQQTIAAQARRRLAAMQPPSPAPRMVQEQIVFADNLGQIRFIDGNRGLFYRPDRTVAIGNLDGSNMRVVFTVPGTAQPSIVASPDLDKLLIILPPASDLPRTYYMMNADGSGLLELHPDRSVLPASMSWTPDKKFLIRGGDQIDRVSAADGTVTQIMPAGGMEITFLTVSPDGEFIMFGQGRPGPVHLIAMNGGESRKVLDIAFPIGWADARHFVAAVLGGPAPKVQAIPITNGVVSGEPIAIMDLERTLGAFQTTRTGDLIYSRVRSVGELAPYVMATADDSGRLGDWKPVELVDRNGPPLTAWSPDGNRFAYHSVGSDASAAVTLRMFNPETGEDRELYRSQQIAGCVWGNVQSKLLCADLKSGDTRILTIDPNSGATEEVGVIAGPRRIVSISPDDRILNLAIIGPRARLVAWEMATGRETEHQGEWQSPDGRFAVTFPRNAEGSQSIHIADTRTGRVTVRYTPRYVEYRAFDDNPYTFTPSGEAFVFWDRDPEGTMGLYRIPTAGGEAKRIGDYPNTMGALIMMSANERRITLEFPPLRPDAAALTYWRVKNYLRVN